MREGVVTFLDVLGWKGIWLRRSLDVIEEMQKLVGIATTLSRGIGLTHVLSISDTIVLLTEGDARKGLELHGRMGAALICESIRLGLPLRGATAFGEFFVADPSFLVGPAVDEAASWHESVDWIGIVQAPSALLVHDGKGSWRKARAPVKGGGSWDIPCVDWPSAWRQDGQDRDDLHESFSVMGPFDPVIAAKYMHTLAFYGDDPTPSPAAPTGSGPLQEPRKDVGGQPRESIEAGGLAERGEPVTAADPPGSGKAAT